MPQPSSISASSLCLKVFNTMDPGAIEISGSNLLQDFDISPSMLTAGLLENDIKFPEFFPGVMQRYFYSYVAALHLADSYFIEEVSKPNIDYEEAKTKFLAMIQELPEELLKQFFKRNDHALRQIPCDLPQKELIALGEKAFNIISKNGYDFYNTSILEHIDKSFQKNKQLIKKDVISFFNLNQDNPSHERVSSVLGEQFQSFVENEEAQHQEHVRVICQYLSGAYTLNELPESQQMSHGLPMSIFCPDYQQQQKFSIPLVFRTTLSDIFLPIQKDITADAFCHYTHSIGIKHLKRFREHLDKANRLVFALDQLRLRYQNALNKTPS